MNGRDEKCMQQFGSKNVKERDLSGDEGVDGMIIL
jgi:hypothetical protein